MGGEQRGQALIVVSSESLDGEPLYSLPGKAQVWQMEVLINPCPGSGFASSSPAQPSPVRLMLVEGP